LSYYNDFLKMDLENLTLKAKTLGREEQKKKEWIRQDLLTKEEIKEIDKEIKELKEEIKEILSKYYKE